MNGYLFVSALKVWKRNRLSHFAEPINSVTFAAVKCHALICLLLAFVALVMPLSAYAEPADSVVPDYEHQAELFLARVERERQPVRTNLLFTGALGYEHSLEHKHFVKSAIAFDWDAARWFQLNAGLRVTTRNIYNLTVKGDFRLPLKGNRFLALNNSYIYGIYADRNFMDFEIALVLRYEQNYFSISLGAMSHFQTPFIVKEGKRRYDWATTWTYSLRGWLKPKDAEWNIGAEFTNVRPFQTDDGRCPSFILHGIHLLRPRYGDPGFNIIWQAGCRTIAAPHSLTYGGCWATVGISCWL